MKDILWIKTNLHIKLGSCTSQSGDTHYVVQLKKGKPQGLSLKQERMLSPPLWGPVINKHVWGLNEGYYYTAGYENDNARLTNGKFPQTV